ncbi:MAG TPA: di-trans,poly-cis-decaprenylcistransferase [Archaeoglobaceae archaeon]|nr:di-trans,poly-cis-decaprenylcistransferase [Archaeoglobaceae archaeon]
MYYFKNLSMDFIRKLYEKRLEKQILSEKIPQHIMVVADEIEFIENISKFRSFINWCRKFGVKEITICIHVFHPVSFEMLEKIAQRLKKGENYKLRLFTGGKFDSDSLEGFTVNLIAGYGGRTEITDAVKKIAERVEKNELNPESITEEDIERFLSIKESPDLIMRAGEEIPDFLIWQSIYSELYFLDVDWKSFRYVDFMRCLRDYQRRERRYGK